jgi:hypothetical protein
MKASEGRENTYASSAGRNIILCDSGRAEYQRAIRHRFCCTGGDYLNMTYEHLLWLWSLLLRSLALA